MSVQDWPLSPDWPMTPVRQDILFPVTTDDAYCSISYYVWTEVRYHFRTHLRDTTLQFDSAIWTAGTTDISRRR